MSLNDDVVYNGNVENTMLIGEKLADTSPFIWSPCVPKKNLSITIYSRFIHRLLR